MKYNIALSGTFNVENFGDLMFPEVFKMSMQKRGLDFELFLFSPGKTTKKALDESTTIYSTSEIENVHKQHPIDAVIIGGGALVHYSKIPVKLPGDNSFIDYCIHDSWLTPLAFALRNNIKVFFNLPQVPFTISNLTQGVTKVAFDSLDYVSLRDNFSKQYIESIYDCDAPEIHVCPDSVCCLPNLVDYDKLSEIRSNIFSTSSKYAIIQFNPQIPEGEDEYLLKIINEFKSHNLEVVLLPIGYTHNDDQALSDFKNKYNCECTLITQKLNIFETAAMLAGCEIYFGASFHGAITAIAYGKKAISYNYISPKNKNQEIFNMYGISDFVVETSKNAYDVVKKLLNNEIAFSPNLKNVSDSVEEHFNTLYDLITTPKSRVCDYENIVSELFKILPDLVHLENKQITSNKQNEMTQQYISGLEALKDAQSEELNMCHKEMDVRHKRILELESIEKAQSEELSACHEKILALETTINSLNSTATAANHNLLEMQNSFFWKITSPVRKVIQKLKDFAARYPAILKTLLFTKGFLSGGINDAKQRVSNYNSTLPTKEKKELHIISKQTRKLQTNHTFSKDVKFSILVPLYNTPKDFLIEMIDSVKNQTYSNWELCLADGSDNEHSYVRKYCLRLAAKDKRIVYKKLTENKGISENTNECIKMASGNYIALFDHDDVLHPSVLFECMKAICEHDADFVYTDEAVFLGSDITDIISYHFKPDFAFDNLLANNYICHFSTFKTSLIDEVGMFRHKYDGSQDHDIILRLTHAAKNVIHIPKVLYFWRSHSNSVAMDINSKAYAITAGQTAVHDFLETIGFDTVVESSPAYPTIYKINYKIDNNPKISIIIPNKNHAEQLKSCINSITDKSSYSNYEIIVVDNQSTDRKVLDYYNHLATIPNVKILSYDKEFNYSDMVNTAVKECCGEYVLLLDSDTQVITSDWIEELLMYAQRTDVGAVGAKLLFPNDIVQHAGIILGLGQDRIASNSHLGIDNNTNQGYMGKLFYAQNITAVTSACLLVKKDTFIAVGGFDKQLSIVYPDVDFCLKLRDKGLLNILNPFSVLYHTNEQVDYDKDVFNYECRLFKKKWNTTIQKGDPYYNPNFSLDHSYLIAE